MPLILGNCIGDAAIIMSEYELLILVNRNIGATLFMSGRFKIYQLNIGIQVSIHCVTVNKTHKHRLDKACTHTQAQYSRQYSASGGITELPMSIKRKSRDA